jgi:hypothetical protein
MLPLETITQRIVVLRSPKVLLDEGLASLYGVPTGRFNEQVKRNPARCHHGVHGFEALSAWAAGVPYPLNVCPHPNTSSHHAAPGVFYSP